MSGVLWAGFCGREWREGGVSPGPNRVVPLGRGSVGGVLWAGFCGREWLEGGVSPGPNQVVPPGQEFCGRGSVGGVLWAGFCGRGSVGGTEGSVLDLTGLFPWAGLRGTEGA